MGDSPPLELTLYGRSWCHLCDDMLTGLRALEGGRPFRVAVIDVDSDRELEQRFGEKVPVLMHGDRELCHYHLNVAAVTEYLLNFR
ncbi:MAG: glutaredoxin family protein [Burkholderiales bacterium]|nr:glutaredoxin family protein [Rubrivivax sp.]MDP2397468.1 glutaredoxin family protein [Burkholderiales bacterium]